MSMDDKCVLVCSGPSAVLYRPEDWGDWALCAANRASELMDARGYPYQWAAHTDGGALVAHNPRPTVGVIQSRNMFEQHKTRWGNHWAECRVFGPEDARWGRWTGYAVWTTTCAIACLIRMGYNRIVAFGMDWVGLDDWDGPVASNRSAQRWQNESDIINKILRGNPQASFRRITMEEQIEAEQVASEEAPKKRGPGRPRKNAAPKDVAEAVEPQPPKPAFKPYTFDDLAKNNVGRCLRKVVVRKMDPVLGVVEKPLSSLEEVAELERFPAPNGKDIDRPFTNFALMLGSRGHGSRKRSGENRAHAVIEQARAMLKANAEASEG